MKTATVQSARLKLRASLLCHKATDLIYSKFFMSVLVCSVSIDAIGFGRWREENLAHSQNATFFLTKSSLSSRRRSGVSMFFCMKSIVAARDLDDLHSFRDLDRHLQLRNWVSDVKCWSSWMDVYVTPVLYLWERIPRWVFHMAARSLARCPAHLAHPLWKSFLSDSRLILQRFLTRVNEK